jgi:hypothetical protein
MANDRGVKTPNKQYTSTIDFVTLVRDSIGGEAVIKRDDKIEFYLPSRCEHVNDIIEKQRRYKEYAKGAEFDDIPAQTLDSIVGCVFRNAPNFDDIPPNLSYLIDDADGDGLKLDELLRIGISEMLSMNYFGMLAEYSDLSNTSMEELTVSRAKDLGLRSSIKVYPRESIINWNYKRVNGVLQLSLLVLKEAEDVERVGSFETTKEHSYLVLGLDEDGEYYQQKYVSINEGKWSDIEYPQADGKNLNYIPFEFAMSENLPKGTLPSRLGYVAPICSKTIHRFRISADMKECMLLNGAPMTYSTGWDDHSIEMYKAMTGKDYISTGAGAHIPLGEGSTVGILSWNMDASAYTTYMDRNEREIRALGGKYDTTDGNGGEETATAAMIKAADKNGSLTNSVNNLENAVSKVIGYCAEFMGEKFDGGIVLNREFYTHKLTPQERTNILNEWQSGLISQNEALRQLERGGVLVEDAETMLNEIANSGE